MTGGRALGNGWGNKQSSKLSDGAGLGTCKGSDDVRIGGVSERLGVGEAKCRGLALCRGPELA
jgi:hypothetical protein